MTTATHSTTPVYRLQCKTQCYDWGRLGDVSKVAKYAQKSGTTIDPSSPYAELWMGTHPNAPSVLMDQPHASLRDLINDHVELSTEPIYQQYHGDLPFLFKILSIRKALSIQAHPDKALGARLHKEFPKIYKDPNHKPEMAIAITPFEALCGFRPLDEIAEHMKRYPELCELVGTDVANAFLNTVRETGGSSEENDTERSKAALRSVFSAVMNSPDEAVARLLNQLVQRLSTSNDDYIVSKLVLRLDQQYPGGDVGVFAVMLLNYVAMEPGQAIFLGANEPHAYLSGDCVECMAASDNVVRAGLTPKFKDVKVLVDMLTYRYGSAESQKMTPTQFGTYSLLYDPPIEEFSVALTRIKADQVEKHEPLAGPSIMIVTGGNGTLTANDQSFDIEEGYVYFIGANTPVSFNAGSSGSLEFYRAFTLLA
ncbi:phosphomannose isomerase type I [Radiomyces spectabilis]|uniref:phosphomannose isomerase type I n=1 Tax=Radiomyces spectabilis TaxID=64574 RepID=UPI00221F8CED|nr:phosphomannose isomerase type I [Radiomyces spectabilis]KAI8369467.1 phosphomannose isomerase type I [Radiomyces spectabilis]